MADEPSFQTMIKEVADKFKSEDADQYNVPQSLPSKSVILQSARAFHDPMVVRNSPRKCCTILSQLLHLINVASNDSNAGLTRNEATDVFFGVTKLFMSEDASLRRMVYLFIKEVAAVCEPSDVLIVTSCLTKDMTCDVDLYRGNALRVLARVMDTGMLSAIERYIKGAIVDNSPQVASAALVSSIHLCQENPGNFMIIKRWVSEITTAAMNGPPMVQFHALSLLTMIRKGDRLAVRKIVAQMSQGMNRNSPLSKVVLVRQAISLLQSGAEDDDDASNHLKFLDSCLRDKSEMVVYEAARSICSLGPNVEKSNAISSLQLFLSSPKSVVRFGAMRTLAALADLNARAVAKCNEDFEALIGDSNRSISTLAITTLLKTGSESHIERYLKQISNIIGEIGVGDEYKVQIVTSISTLCKSYPHKHRILISFLANFLREEGGFEFKKSIVFAITELMNEIEESKESSLLALCEFIEDCEFIMLSTHILAVIGDLGPQTTAPARYIRFLYNRVILEHAAVRAAAVSALSKFGANCPFLRASIVTLLKRSLLDEDDETRDRATLAVSILSKAMEECPYSPATDDEEDYTEEMKVNENDPAAYALLTSMPMTFDTLEKSLMAYKNGPMDESKLSFDTLPIVEAYVPPAATESSKTANINSATGVSAQSPQKQAEAVNPAAIIYSTPELASLGRVSRTTAAIPLTESETEYVVKCVKHILDNHIVLQFQVTNTIQEQRLEEVTVTLEELSSNYEVMECVPAEKISYGETANTFVVLGRVEGEPLEEATYNCILNFNVVQVDPDTGDDEGDMYSEEYPLEDLDIKVADFMGKTMASDFRAAWEGMGNNGEVLEKFALQFKSLENGVSAIVNFLGMMPVDGTDVIKGNAGGKPHMLHMSGMFYGVAGGGGKQVLARAQMGLDSSKGGVILKIAVRSESTEISRLVADCIR